MTFKRAFDIVQTSMGATSIRDNSGGEILHNPVGPWKESRSLYVEQSRLRSRLQIDTKSPLVLYDIGLGAGFNAMAAIEAKDSLFDSQKNIRHLSIVSFESDLSLFDFALQEIESFPENKTYFEILKSLRTNGIYNSETLTWKLCGPFSKEAENEGLPRAEVVFFDPYSPKINPEMWTIEVFSQIKRMLSSELPACLVTYSTATKIRTAMLLAGFYVGQGDSSGLKEETTYAGSILAELKIPLGERWFQRWTRSHDGLPLGLHGLDHGAILTQLKNHPQFLNVELAK